MHPPPQSKQKSDDQMHAQKHFPLCRKKGGVKRLHTHFKPRVPIILWMKNGAINNEFRNSPKPPSKNRRQKVCMSFAFENQLYKVCNWEDKDSTFHCVGYSILNKDRSAKCRYGKHVMYAKWQSRDSRLNVFTTQQSIMGVVLFFLACF